MALNPALLDVLACPEDKGPLLYFADDNLLYNSRLQKSYRIVDDIPVLLMDEASAVSDDDHAALLAKADAAGLKPTFEA